MVLTHLDRLGWWQFGYLADSLSAKVCPARPGRWAAVVKEGVFHLPQGAHPVIHLHQFHFPYALMTMALLSPSIIIFLTGKNGRKREQNSLMKNTRG